MSLDKSPGKTSAVNHREDMCMRQSIAKFVAIVAIERSEQSVLRSSGLFGEEASRWLARIGAGLHG
ncbi:hypothetical protein [Nonomuraea dietziae]|uniref:Uncharacterized protein n=1 Tax=Nonomuraea dietziae TaxID=65515 RepID=A0A7W5VAY3_9ACTN|nr:hypothetical protein [Nonomuraea dietziae]MBB3733917.1 hypothetical protein [Nonomuraea dietziae]